MPSPRFPRPAGPRSLRAATARPGTWVGFGTGLAALAWILLRSARNPARLRYPCQQAALAHVGLLLVLPLSHALARGLRARRPLVSAALVALLLGVLVIGDVPGPVAALDRETRRAPMPHGEYTTTLYLVRDAGGPSGDHHAGVDELLATMGAGGLKFYRSAVASREAGPDGIVGAADVVLVKVNSQWSERGGTNTDVLRGLVARILEHPDGFAGEIVVVENTQGMGRLDWPAANAEDHSQSVTRVVEAFAGAGEPVSAYLWDTIRGTSVGEYSAGDDRDGYVLGAYDPQTGVTPSYPKFRTAGGHRVSLAHGLWDSGSGSYDDAHLTFLNVPVLKCHGAVYGVTASVKNHMGCVTTGLGTGAHAAVRYGALARYLVDVRMPDLNILDGIYILARPDLGPSCAYANATRTDVLMAGTDPVALDWWAAKHILVPAIVANGYPSYPKQDPDNPGSIFRTYLDATMDLLHASGIDATTDPDRIVVRESGASTECPAPRRAAPARAGTTAFPNPFVEHVDFRFTPVVPGTYRVTVHDVTGRCVRLLGARGEAGRACDVAWDGRDDRGRRVAPGTYFLRAARGAERFEGRVTRL